jgi:hypothetical protein
MDRLRCGPLAAWASAWLQGSVAFDDVLVAVSQPAAAPALAVSQTVPQPSLAGHLANPDSQPAQVGELLIAWRQSGGPVRLILPVPGDVRGCPEPASFRTAALDAGQAVVGLESAIVPTLIDHRPSSAPATLVWRRYDVDPAAADHVSVPDAQFELAEAIRECATVLARNVSPQVAATGLLGAEPDADADVSGELARARRAGERLNLPAGFPARAVMLIAQAERLAAVLTIAGPAGHRGAPRPAGRLQRADLTPVATRPGSGGSSLVTCRSRNRPAGSGSRVRDRAPAPR